MSLQPLYLLIMTLVVCGHLHADEIVIAADPWCPYTCDKAGGQNGFMIDIAEKIFSKSGHKIKYEILSWSRSLADTRAGKLNAAAGAAEGDSEGMIMHKNEFISASSCFFVKPGESWKWDGVKSLNGKTLGVIQEYVYGDDELDKYIKNNAANPKLVDAINGDNLVDRNVKKVLLGRVFTFIEDQQVVGYYTKTNQKDALVNAGCLTPSKIYIAFSGKNPKSKTYADILDKGIEEMKKSGEYKQILDKYGVKAE